MIFCCAPWMSCLLEFKGMCLLLWLRSCYTLVSSNATVFFNGLQLLLWK